MTDVRITVNPQISGAAVSPSGIGSVRKAIEWPRSKPMYSFTPGTGAGQMDIWYDAFRTLASNTSESLDLTGTALEDATGQPIALAKVKLLAIHADPANTTNLTVGNAASTPFIGPFGAGTHTLVLKPGEMAMFVAPDGYTVAASTGDLLKVSNALGASASYSLLIGGTSA